MAASQKDCTSFYFPVFNNSAISSLQCSIHFTNWLTDFWTNLCVLVLLVTQEMCHVSVCF